MLVNIIEWRSYAADRVTFQAKSEMTKRNNIWLKSRKKTYLYNSMQKYDMPYKLG